MNADRPSLFGHPTGLFALFFAEMWERFSYYGMRALLVFYMIKGFLGYGDTEAYRVYGAYTALVYMTPFFGGMVADRFLGARRAVVLGGLLMAAGHLMMGLDPSVLEEVEALAAYAGQLHEVGVVAFYTALALLIVGNGFFKPNISTIVGSLYPPGSPQRDGGFTIFYMGINLGAAMAPLLCGYVGETYGWHYGFGLATFGMLVGLAVFVVPALAARLIILGGALVTFGAMIALQDNWLLLLVNGFVAVMLLIAGVLAFVALGRGGLPPESGGPPDPELLTRAVAPGAPLTLEWAFYGASVLVMPIIALLVWSNRVVTLIPESLLNTLAASESALVRVLGTVAGEVSTPTGLLLMLTGLLALGFISFEALRSTRVERDRLTVVVVLMFFSMLFWVFFEQAGTSVNLFTDRNVDRVLEERVVTETDVGSTLRLTLNQEQLGYSLDGRPLTLDALDEAREAKRLEVSWPVAPEHVGMGVGGSEIPASTFQSANPIFILLFGLPFSMLWVFLGRMGAEPNTPLKFSLGLLQLGLGFVALWWGAASHDPRGMVGMHWLLLGYLLHTTGELCLSPVGLSMVTKLSPRRLVSTVMGAWFLATAFSSLFSAIIATFTGVGGEGGDEKAIPPPIVTVEVYGAVFGQIAVAAILAAVVLAVLAPFLARWTHPEVEA